MQRRALVWTTLWLVLQGCNLLLGNDSATTNTDESPDANGAGGGAGSSGVASSGSPSSSGQTADASTDAGPTECPCGGVPGGTCAACTPVPLPLVSTDGQPVLADDLAAIGDYLFALNGGLVQRFLLQAGVVVSSRTLGDSAADIETSLVRLGERDDSATYYRIPSTGFGVSLERCSTGDVPNCIPVSDLQQKCTGLVASLGGVAFLGDTPRSTARIYGNAAGTLMTYQNTDQPLSLTATADYLLMPDDRVNGQDTAIKLARYAPDIAVLTAPIVTGGPIPIQALAANEERVFFAPCNVSAVCARNVDGSGGNLAVVDDSLQGQVQVLHADANLLLIGTIDNTFWCSASACVPVLLEGGPLRAVTRSADSVFILAGTTVYRAQRIPLRAL